MRGENKLSTITVDSRVLKQRNNILQQLEMKLGVQLVNQQRTSLSQNKQDNRKYRKQLLRAFRLISQIQLIILVVDFMGQEKASQAKRQTWGELNPVTRSPENGKAYNRNKARNWKREYHGSSSSGTFICIRSASAL